MTDLNLIPAPIRERAAVRRRVTRWSVFLGVYALIVGAACLGLRTIGGQERTQLEAEEARIAERLERAEETIKSLRQQAGADRQRLEASETVGVHPDWSLLMRALADLRGDQVMISAIDVKVSDQAAPEANEKPAKGAAAKSKAKPRRVESYNVHIKGRAITQMGVLEFVRRIEDLKLMAEVHPPQSRAEPYLGVQGVAFEMDCRLTERAFSEAAAPTEERP